MNWKADTIRYYGFDRSNGFPFGVADVARAPATLMASKAVPISLAS